MKGETMTQNWFKTACSVAACGLLMTVAQAQKGYYHKGGRRTDMLRLAISAAAAGFLMGHIVEPAQASTYDLTLTPLTGPDSGTGTFSINGPAGTGTYALTSVDISIDGHNYTLGNGAGTATFSGGVFEGLTYGGQVGVGLDTLELFAPVRSYFFLDVDSSGTFGTVSATPSATPLPSTWTTMLVGLAGLAFVLYRRNWQSKVQVFASWPARSYPQGCARILDRGQSGARQHPARSV
jgi:hypothetical protein